MNRIARPRSKREGCPQREGSRQLRVGGKQHSFIHLSAHLFFPNFNHFSCIHIVVNNLDTKIFYSLFKFFKISLSLSLLHLFVHSLIHSYIHYVSLVPSTAVRSLLVRFVSL